MPETLETRETLELTVRAEVDAEARTVRGLAVPYNETISVWGMRERLAPGSVEGDGAKLFFRHSEPIGIVTSGADSDAGWNIAAKISTTARGDEAYTLARDGVLDGLSIGFEPLEWHIERDDELDADVTVYTRVRVREVSLVPFPAYPSATITEVREARHHKETPAMGDQQNTDTDALVEIREEVRDLGRRLSAVTDNPQERAAVTIDTRNAGQILKAIVAGDEDVIREYNEIQERAYEGGVLADAVHRPAWVGDLTRIFDASSGVLADVFATGTLPEQGESIEYAQLKANTITVEEVAEGEDIPMGKVSLETKTAPVKTYAGGTELSRKSIERASINVVNTSLEALSQAAGVRKKLVLRAAFDELVAARKTAGDVVTVPALAEADAYDWLDALIDAATNLEDKGATIDAAIVSKDVFKSLIRLETAGHRVFRVGGDRTIGELDLTGLNGDIAGLTVRLDTGAGAGSASFVNGRAIRAYDSPLVSLSDDKISNLTKQFAVYRYGAVAPEVPGFVVPVSFGAGA